MMPELRGSNVVAWCSRCNSRSTFVSENNGTQYGALPWIARNYLGTNDFVLYRLHRCSGCDRGGVAEIHNQQQPQPLMSQGARLVQFFPTSIETTALPPGTPEGIVAEFKEAERCANAGAWRGATAMLRSALEKTLKANGPFRCFRQRSARALAASPR